MVGVVDERSLRADPVEPERQADDVTGAAHAARGAALVVKRGRNYFAAGFGKG
jgi:hypothetical protein